ncbi:MAG TPA: lysophospholipid acyltransferase family protein [Candidatus Omnitrophota bacterium]|nr:lysophospholipid acyltransferase family protein [Candidatus Omnitrophota bacterium]
MIAVSLPDRFRGWKGRLHTSVLVSLWARGAARITGIKIKTYGKKPAGRAGLVVSNHLGYTDIVVHASIFPLRFTPSTDVAKIPVVGAVTATSNPIFVDRKSSQSAKKAARDFAKTMRRGMFLIVYPEGTSSDGKNGILPFKSTPFDAAAGGKMPIFPVLTRYPGSPDRPSVPWYGDMTFFSHFWGLLGAGSIAAEVLFLDPIEPGDMSRKELAVHTHKIMSAEWKKWNRGKRIY